MAEELKTVAKFGKFGENSSYVSLNYVDPVEVKVNAADYDAAMALLAQTDKA